LCNVERALLKAELGTRCKAAYLAVAVAAAVRQALVAAAVAAVALQGNGA
jgi:hypothetical protein